MFQKNTERSSQHTLLLILSPKKEAHVTKTNKHINNKWADVAWRLVGWARYQEVGVFETFIWMGENKNHSQLR